MNILLVGDVNSLALPLAIRFQAERHKAVIVGPQTEAPPLHQGVNFHAVDPAEPLFQEVMQGYRFDAVVFIGNREERVLSQTGPNTGRMIDRLNNSLLLSSNVSARKFFLISSTEVYGASAKVGEQDAPAPITLNGLHLKAAEELCAFYQKQYFLPVTILRVPYVYGEHEHGGLLANILSGFNGDNPVHIPVEAATRLPLLHTDDIADFILADLEDGPVDQLTIANLPAADEIGARELSDKLAESFPSAEVRFTPDVPRRTMQPEGEYARSQLDWTARRTLAQELPELVEQAAAQPKRKTSLLKKLQKAWAGNETLSRWIELITGAAITQYLVTLSGTLLQFRYIDFRLLFVILMGFIHGTVFGLLAALLACVSAIWAWQSSGLDWSLLIYNIENWIPFALYLLAGGITGYLRDRHENDLRFQNQQVALMHDKYQFLYGVYNQIRQIKDHFRDQLIGYRDSFGRIYNVTRELDTLQEPEVIFKALSILEDVMQNRQIAIYSIDSSLRFARLQANSRELTGHLRNSMRLEDLPEIQKAIQENNIFQNTSLLVNYPAYLAPIYNQGAPVAAVAIWQAKFDQYSLAYLNLFRVLCGLIQSALVRATMFTGVNLSNMYMPETRILLAEAFNQVLQVKARMRENQIASFELLKVFPDGKDARELYAVIASSIRSVDYVGQDGEGGYKILLSQTNADNARLVIDRLEKKGVRSELVHEVL